MLEAKQPIKDTNGHNGLALSRSSNSLDLYIRRHDELNDFTFRLFVLLSKSKTLTKVFINSYRLIKKLHSNQRKALLKFLRSLQEGQLHRDNQVEDMVEKFIKLKTDQEIDQKELVKLKDDWEKSEQKIEEKIESFTNQVVALESQNKTLIEQQEKLAKENQEKDKEINNLSNRLDVSQSMIESLLQRVSQLEERMHEHKKLDNELKEKYSVLETQQKEQGVELTEITRELKAEKYDVLPSELRSKMVLSTKLSEIVKYTSPPYSTKESNCMIETKQQQANSL